MISVTPDDIGLEAFDAGRFGREASRHQHRLHQLGLFSDAALADVLDRYPRDQLGVFTMGEDPSAWRSWRRGRAGELSGAELIETVKTGRIWLNLRKTNEYLDDYAALTEAMFGALKAGGGPRGFRHDMGLLISSPKAQVFYHLDIARVTLWHVRGEKRVWLYPVETPWVDEETLERIVLKETAEQFTFRPELDDGAQVFDLEPGEMLHWPQNAPHRIVNGDSLNVSLSAEFQTAESLIRANAIWANGWLRRRLGWSPQIQPGRHPASLAKFALARGLKAIGAEATPPEPLPPSFAVDPSAPMGVGGL